MIGIRLHKIGKHYNREWIFKNIDYEFTSNDAYVIIGSNGSGKSTLLQILASSILPSEGNIVYSYSHPSAATSPLTGENIFQHLSLAAPYLELFEEYTLLESLHFHSRFKKFQSSLTPHNIVDLSGLKKAKDKILKYYSSGMKQRVRLVLAILSDTPLLLLDEPTSNLDKEGIAWYQELIQHYTKNRLIVVCSNQQMDEYRFCTKEILIERFK